MPKLSPDPALKLKLGFELEPDAEGAESPLDFLFFN